MTKEEREKLGLVGKQTLTAPNGEKHVVDFDDEDAGVTLSYEEYMNIIRNVRPGVRYYSKTTGELIREELDPDNSFKD